MALGFIPDVTASAGAVTVNVSSLGAKRIYTSGTTDPTATSLIAGNLYTLVYNGTAFEIGGGSTITLAGDVTGASNANTVVKINGTLLSGLATGTLCNTTATGVPSICTTITVTGAITSGSGSGVGGAIDLVQGTLPALGTTAVTLMAPAAVTSYGLLYPGAAPAAGNVLIWGAPSSSISTAVFGATINASFVGGAGTALLNGGALGTPSSGVATNLTGTASGLTAGAVTGFTAGVGTLTGPASSGVALISGGALGTPSSGVATNLTGTASGLTAGAVSGFTAGAGTLTGPATNGVALISGGALGTPSSGTLTNATGLPAAGVVGTAAILGANTFTGVQTISTAGAASTPVISVTGAWYTGGSGTTTTPQVYIVQSGAAAFTGFSTAGTAVGVNAAAGFAGDLMNLILNTNSEFRVSNNGNVTARGGMVIGTGVVYSSSAGGYMYPEATTGSNTGTLRIHAVSGNEAINFGGDTSSFPALVRSSTNLIKARNAADTGSVFMDMSGLYVVGTKFTATGLTVGSLVGGATGGTFTLGANGPGTVVVTMGDTATAPNGWSCSISDRTTLTVLVEQSASTTTTATFNFPAGALSGDVGSFGCIGY